MFLGKCNSEMKLTRLKALTAHGRPIKLMCGLLDATVLVKSLFICAKVVLFTLRSTFCTAL